MRVLLFHCGKHGKFLRSAKGARFLQEAADVEVCGLTLAGFDPMTSTNTEGEGHGWKSPNTQFQNT